MSRATVELDFLGLEKADAARFRPMEPRSSIRGIQSAISRINPQLVRNVFASGGGNLMFHPPVPATESRRLFLSPPSSSSSPAPLLQRLSPASSKITTESPPETAPLTIFYNGTVNVFDVAHDKAESIIKIAEDVNRVNSQEFALLEKLNGDLPMARKKSLQRFLEKRKERLTALGPYEQEEGEEKEEDDEVSSKKEKKREKAVVAASKF